jgi:CheY-like chemotaxis protein
MGVEGGMVKRGRVLLIDDEPFILELLERILSDEYEVATSTSSTDMLARLIAGERYDAILCDMLMPHVTGMELHQALVSYCPEQATRVVFVTGGPTRDAHADFLRSVCFVRKPFSVEGVRAIVRALVG